MHSGPRPGPRRLRPAQSRRSRTLSASRSSCATPHTGAEHSPFERVCVRLLTGDRGFESAFLQRRFLCEPTWSLAEVFHGDVVAVASCVEEIDAALESSLDERAALRLVDAPGMIPPIGDAIAHAAEADPRHLQTRATKLYIFHCRSPGVSTHRRIGF